MRIRLRIERNELPAVNILWAISNTDLRQTVAQFLERVNGRFPLEGESWGLEDYVVTIGGYEALHYNELGVCFQNEDEVVIKPLQYVDVRTRAMTGRNQISEDGRHLVDGVPFGRPLLKRARRPDITIPPRKRQKLLDMEMNDPDDLDEDEDDGEYDPEQEADEEVPLALSASSTRRRTVNFDEEDNDNSEDEEYCPEQEADEEDAATWLKSKKQKRIQVQNAAVEDAGSDGSDDSDDSNDSDDSDDEQSSSSSDDGDSSSEAISSSDDSDSSSDTSEYASDASEESWNGIDQSNPAIPAVRTQEESTVPPDTPPERLSSHGLPYEGSEKTRTRNNRRREQRRLKYLKEAGMLPAGATLSDLHAYQEEHKMLTKVELQRQKMEHERQRLLEQIAAGGVDITGSSGVNGNSSMEMDSEEPESVVMQEENPTSAPQTKRPRVADLTSTQIAAAIEVDIQSKSLEASDLTAIEPVTPRRTRLDAAGANRLIFGSLGVRTPKTQADKEALQKKLAGRPKPNVSTAAPAEIEQYAEADEDPDAWRGRIDLSAVECVDEDVTLSAPPFPFQQRWDSQYQFSKKKRQKKRKHAVTNDDYGEYIETYDKYNHNGSDALNYDDPEEEDLDDDYWEEGALLDDEEEPEKDGFPDLPADVATLPSLIEADAKQGDIIIFEELACSAATGWQPKTIIRTVRLDSNDGDGWHVKFATRDLRPREFDDDGNRVYSKFEMEGLSDDEGAEDEKTLMWDAMAKPRLLQRSG